jgi:hypothetical protein
MTPEDEGYNDMPQPGHDEPQKEVSSWIRDHEQLKYCALDLGNKRWVGLDELAMHLEVDGLLATERENESRSKK